MGMLDFLYKEAQTPDEETKYQAQRMGLLAASARLGQMSQPGQNFSAGNALGQTGMAFANNYYGAMGQAQKQQEEAARKRAMQQAMQGLTPQQQAAINANPAAGMKLLQELMFRGKVPMTTKNVMTIRDPATGQPRIVPVDKAIGGSPYEKTQSPMSSVGKLRADFAAGRISKEVYEQELERREKPGVSINTFDPNADRRKGAGKRYEALSSALPKIRERDYALERMESLVDKVGGGAFAKEKLTAMKIAKVFGFNVDSDKIANMEEFNNLAMGEVMGLISQTKGSISEKEMEAFERASPSLLNTPQGNKQIIKFARHILQREKEVIKHARKLMQDNKNMGVYELDAKIDEYRASLMASQGFEFTEAGTSNTGAPQKLKEKYGLE